MVGGFGYGIYRPRNGPYINDDEIFSEIQLIRNSTFVFVSMPCPA